MEPQTGGQVVESAAVATSGSCKPGDRTRGGIGFTAVLTGILLAFASAQAQIVGHALGVERLANGNTLVTDDIGRVVEVDSLGRLTWAHVRGHLRHAHTARRLAGGNTLITVTGDDSVIEVDRAGDVVWHIVSGIDYPNEAFRLSSGNTLITDRDNNRVIEVDSVGTVVWSYADLVHPHNGSRLTNGNTLVCDSDRDQVVEVTPAGELVWRHAAGLSWPRSAQRLANGNTLIASSNGREILEVDQDGRLLWHHTCPNMPYMAVRLENGNTLISALALVYEVTAGGVEVWRWPGTAPLPYESTAVTNPASGCPLPVHIHRVRALGDTELLPAIVLVPDLQFDGRMFDAEDFAQDLASAGFAVLHFDPEGRGGSSGYPEDDCGLIHQEGLRACVEYLARRPYVDSQNVGILSFGYGITMAAGMLARHGDSVPVQFLIDFEGPADRSQTCADSGGHLPVPADSEAFWQEREAARSIKSVRCAYLRLQTAVDHAPNIPDNRHCIALVDSATLPLYGGSGMSWWTRVNDSLANPPNTCYTLSDPPVYISEESGKHELIHLMLRLRDMAELDVPTAVWNHLDRPVSGRTSVRIAPNPIDRSARIALELDAPAQVTATIHDPAGRRIRELVGGALAPGRHVLLWNGTGRHGREVAPGVYFVAVTTNATRCLTKVVKR